MEKTIYIPVSVGELLDKVSILNIKRDMISDTDKLSKVKIELNQLMDLARPILQDDELERLYDNLLIRILFFDKNKFYSYSK